MPGTIWILAKNKTFLNTCREIFGNRTGLIDVTLLCEKIFTRPKQVLLECNYECQPERCAANFHFVCRFPDYPAFIARPIQMRTVVTKPYAYMISALMKPALRIPEGKIDSFIQLYNPAGPSLHARRSSASIIRLYLDIIRARGQIHSVSSLAQTANRSVEWLSGQFKEVTGFTPKRFIDKIRFCNCLWALVSDSRLVKSIALEYKFKPAAFSQRFYETFNLWPTEVRYGGQSIK